jgi:short-subunit dehydrogenase
MKPKIALVTGASAGIGAATAIQLAQAGFITYAAARRTNKMMALQTHGVHVVHLDLTSEASIDLCLATIRAAHGDIDVLVNNAGYGSYGALEEVPMAEARRQFDVNLFGLATLTQKVIAPMRAQRSGRIINVTSIGGVGAAPYGGWYHATKFALEGYSASLRQELAPFDVEVVVIRPGAIMTEWSGIADQSLIATSGNGPYAQAVRPLSALFNSDKLSKIAVPPKAIADVILQAATVAKPKTVYTAPNNAKVLVFLRWLLSDRWHDAMTRAGMGLPRKMT